MTLYTQIMRLFIAIPLPPEAQAALRQYEQQAAEHWSNFRFVLPEQLHITLRFLGELHDADMEGARKAFASVSPGDPFALRLGETLKLPPRGPPRVLAVKLGGMWIG